MGGASDSCECVYNDDLSFNKFKAIMDLKIEFMERQRDTTMQVIGAWVNDEGDAFIEVSDIVFDREEAIALGKGREEEAIWASRTTAKSSCHECVGTLPQAFRRDWLLAWYQPTSTVSTTILSTLMTGVHSKLVTRPCP